MMSSSPHVLFVENGTGFGGATKCLLSLVDLCASQGWRVSVAVAYSVPELERADSPCTVIPLHGNRAHGLGRRIRRLGRAKTGSHGQWASIGAFWTAAVASDLPVACNLARYARRNGVTLIHANNELLANRVAIVAGRLAGVPVMSHQRGWSYASRLVPLLARWSDRLVAVSDAVADHLMELGVAKNKVFRVYDGIDRQRFAHGAYLRETTRRELGFAPQDQVVGLPAVLLPWKGHEIFLRAFAQVAKSRPRAKALLVGASPENAPDIRPLIEQRVRELGIGDRVRMVGHADDMPPMYAAMDVVVHASVQAEPFGLVVAEGMAAGKTVIAADAGGPTEIIRHGTDGWRYAMGDVHALAEALAQLLADATLRERLARGAADRARFFAPEEFQSAMLAVYRGVIPDMSDNGAEGRACAHPDQIAASVSGHGCLNPSP